MTGGAPRSGLHADTLRVSVAQLRRKVERLEKQVRTKQTKIDELNEILLHKNKALVELAAYHRRYGPLEEEDTRG